MNLKSPTPSRQVRATAAGLVTTLLLAGTLLAGCGHRTYLTRSHGRANSEAFDRQKVSPSPRPRTARGEPTEGLDSQEASAVSRSYRRSLAGKENTEVAGQPNLIMNSAAGTPPTPYMPPPSVPGGQQ